jgi:hypothetical protein
LITVFNATANRPAMLAFSSPSAARQHDPRSHHHALFRGAPANQRLQPLTVLVAQLDHERALPRHRTPNKHDAATPAIHSPRSHQLTRL